MYSLISVMNIDSSLTIEYVKISKQEKRNVCIHIAMYSTKKEKRLIHNVPIYI